MMLNPFFSLDDEPGPDSLIALKIKDDEEIQNIFKVRPSAQPSHPIPLALVHIFVDKWSKSIIAITLLDTRAHRSIISPDVLPKHCWKPHQEYFRATDNQVFHTNFQTKKPITIQILFQCKIKKNFLGSNLVGRDLVLAFDVFYQLDKLRILSHGIQFKFHFKLYTIVPYIFPILQVHIKSKLSSSSANSHTEFL